MLLGKNIKYPEKYSTELLFPIPRSENRLMHHIDANSFAGFDVWHAWEFSFLTINGLPVSGVLKIMYPSDSEYIIESKSLKLYLNGFNMTKFGQSVDAGINETIALISDDLSKKLRCNVYVNFFYENEFSISDFESFLNLEKDLDPSIKFDRYNEYPDYIQAEKSIQKSHVVYSNLLRSNCKVTGQPDFGTVFISYSGKYSVKNENLVKYIVSLRNENHFHEEICELIFKRLFENLSPDRLMVACIYTRRGGIDICPVRSTHSDMYPKNLINPKLLSAKLFRQ